jgi:ribosomal protein S19
MKKRKARSTSGDKTICLPMPPDVEYEVFVEDTLRYRTYLDELIKNHPELFPAEIIEGYSFHGFVESGKLHLRTRRIRLKRNRQAYQLRPDTVMPYMIGHTDEVEKGLYLRRYGVPYEAIAHVLGRNAMYWYHATQSIGRISIVGATVKDPSAFPP